MCWARVNKSPSQPAVGAAPVAHGLSVASNALPVPPQEANSLPHHRKSTACNCSVQCTPPPPLYYPPELSSCCCSCCAFSGLSSGPAPSGMVGSFCSTAQHRQQQHQCTQHSTAAAPVHAAGGASWEGQSKQLIIGSQHSAPLDTSGQQQQQQHPTRSHAAASTMHALQQPDLLDAVQASTQQVGTCRVPKQSPITH